MLGNVALTRRHVVWHVNQRSDQMAARTVLILRPPVCTLVQDSHLVGCVYRLLLVMLCLRHREWQDGAAHRNRDGCVSPGQSSRFAVPGRTC